MKTITTLFVVVCFIISGCTASLVATPPNPQHIEQLKLNTAVLAKLSPFQIAYIKAALGNDIGKLPAEATICLDDILTIIGKAQGREMTDYELGTIGGKWDRMCYLVSSLVLQNILAILGQLR